MEKELVAVKTEVRIQFKEVFTRVKRIESILVAAAGTIIAMLVAVLMKMG
jgi:antitoxin (DNA-binding transcriptional repressor) of toxin-antitoxin stability system